MERSLDIRVAESLRQAHPRNLARRLTTAFLAVTLPGMVILGLVTFRSLGELVSMNIQLHEISESLGATRDLDLALNRTLVPTRDFALSGNPKSRAEFEGALQTTRAKLAGCNSEVCHAASITPREMATALTPGIEAIATAGRSMFDARGHGTFSQADQREIERLVLLSSVRLQRMSAALMVRVEDLQEKSRAVNRRVVLVTSGLAVALVVLASGVAVLFAQRLSRTLSALLAGTRRVMAGDLNSMVEIDDRGELGELASSFNVMLERLRISRTEVEEYDRTLEARVEERSAALARQAVALRQSERMASVGLLASGVAHELNNPLTGILMNASLALEDLSPNPALRDQLQRISSDATRCRNIVEDLRTFSRKREIQKKPGSVGAVIDEAIANVSRDLEARGVSVEREVEANLPEILWDPERILQVLINLLTNAAQALERNGRVTLVARQEGPWLSLVVDDTGPGIPIAHRSRVFDPFFTTKPTGTGLGLAISHGIIEEHGGTIAVESRTRDEVGPTGSTGTRMKILLPLSGEAT